MARDAIVEQGGQSFGVVARVARQLGVGTEALRGWLKQGEIDGGHRPGTSTADAQRIAELEREVRELRRANDILKAASVFVRTPRLCGLAVLTVRIGAGRGRCGDPRRSA